MLPLALLLDLELEQLVAAQERVRRVPRRHTVQ